MSTGCFGQVPTFTTTLSVSSLVESRLELLVKNDNLLNRQRHLTMASTGAAEADFITFQQCYAAARLRRRSTRLWQVRCLDATPMKTAVLLLTALLSPGCGAPEPAVRSTQAQQDDRLARLPAANARSFGEFNTFALWANPFLVVHPDGIELLPSDRKSPGPRVSVGEIESTLNSLPREAWPLGRTVAVQENALGSGPAQKANLIALLSMLESHAVLVNRWPSA